MVELGGKGKNNSAESVDRHIRKALGGSEAWVLLGGPPCQAYSSVGRRKMIGAMIRKNLNGANSKEVSPKRLENAREMAEKEFSRDARHTLYREYLRIIAKHAPPIFIMENVRGILSSKRGGERIFPKILKDMEHPYGIAHEYWPNKRFKRYRYRIVSFVTGKVPDEGAESEFLIRSENYGIPQARYRVILLGIREDISARVDGELPCLADNSHPLKFTTMRDVLGYFPRLRSGVSRGQNTEDRWINELKKVATCDWLKAVDSDISAEIHSALKKIFECPPPTTIDCYAPYLKRPDLKRWYYDRRLKKLPNSDSTRTHMASDLHRYLFISAFGAVKKTSPRLVDFPEGLLPDHNSVDREDLKNADFADRFRVQNWDRPSTTVTCHISKDGHYFIHPDPSQCRSFTVREAARLQTFPDNYSFCGKQTHQYTQVGNAVPPLLARQLAAIAHRIFREIVQ